MQDVYDGDTVALGEKKDQVVTVRQVSQVRGKVRSLGCDLRVSREELELLVQLVAELSGGGGIVGGDIADDSFEVLNGNTLGPK